MNAWFKHEKYKLSCIIKNILVNEDTGTMQSCFFNILVFCESHNFKSGNFGFQRRNGTALLWLDISLYGEVNHFQWLNFFFDIELNHFWEWLDVSVNG